MVEEKAEKVRNNVLENQKKIESILTKNEMMRQERHHKMLSSQDFSQNEMLSRFKRSPINKRIYKSQIFEPGKIKEGYQTQT